MKNLTNDLAKLQRSFKELYNDGLIGLGTDYVQVTPELFSNLRVGNKVDITQDDDGGFVQLSCNVDGVNFITLI